MKTPPEAFEAGDKAYHEGVPLHLNPHFRGPNHTAWKQGWMNAWMRNPQVMADRLKPKKDTP